MVVLSHTTSVMIVFDFMFCMLEEYCSHMLVTGDCILSYVGRYEKYMWAQIGSTTMKSTQAFCGHAEGKCRLNTQRLFKTT